MCVLKLHGYYCSLLRDLGDAVRALEGRACLCVKGEAVGFVGAIQYGGI